MPDWYYAMGRCSPGTWTYVSGVFLDVCGGAARLVHLSKGNSAPVTGPLHFWVELHDRYCFSDALSFHHPHSQPGYGNQGSNVVIKHVTLLMAQEGDDGDWCHMLDRVKSFHTLCHRNVCPSQGDGARYSGDCGDGGILEAPEQTAILWHFE